jgi:dipeptidyl aminopeptidase/acylaminoacyl peptidase
VNSRIAALFLLALGMAGANSIEQYLNAPFASDLSAAPGGGRVAWVVNERGARNVWVAAAPDWEGRRLTSYSQDDGLDLGEIRWSADGRTLVYTRGGDLDTNADAVPNPRNLAETPEQAIYALAFEGGMPKRLANGRSAAVSKSGRVAFIRNGQIWMTSLDGAKPFEAVHTAARNTGAQSSDLRWSPDGETLAFTSSRGDHSFIGLYRVQEKTVSYLDPSVDRDAGPVWSPDGHSIAYLRTAYSSRVPVGPQRDAATPWSIRVADAATGKAREIWRADKGPGSVFHGIDSEDHIFWTSSGRIVFPWERDGWLHLYSVAVEGGSARLLTPGEFEVDHVTLSYNRRDVLYSSNQDDLDRRHLWRVPASGGTPVRLTAGEGIEWSPMDAGGGNLVLLRSSATEIARASVRNGENQLRDMGPPATGLPKDLIQPQPVIFPAADGLQIHGQLFLPPAGAARHPAVVFFHGGSRRQMLLGYHPMRYYSNAYSLNQYLASLGYVVLSVNYRSGIGYGLNFREALGYGTAGGSEYRDVVGAGLYLAARAEVDPKRIGVWGGSYGGYLAALALARSSDVFKAGVVLHGVEDWSIRPGRTLNARNLDTMREVERTAFEASPLADVKTWRSPVLLIHGDDDRNVDFSQTVRLAEALRAQGVDFEDLILPGEVHDFLLTESWIKAYSAAVDFFRRRLF